MFSKILAGLMAVACAVLFAPPSRADVAASGYDRMDGDYIRPNRRPTPKRNFNTTLSDADRLNVYSVDRGVRTRVHANTGSGRTVNSSGERILDQQNQPYKADVNRVDPDSGRYAQPEDGLPANPDVEDGGEPLDGNAIETTEAEDVVEEGESQQPVRITIDPETALVFCSKSLLEFHWDRNCPMLKNVSPTPLTLISARNSNYVECTECGILNRRQR